jgi:CRISPR/Cas system CSM-associated protein Csm2 small subunit
MAGSTTQSHDSSQIFQVCATAMVQSQTHTQQLRLYAESQRQLAESHKKEAESLRSELQQLRSAIFYVQRERDGENSKCAILQELIDTQRCIIRDYERERQGQISSHPQGLMNFGADLQHFAHVPVTQDNPVQTGGVETGVLHVDQIE